MRVNEEKIERKKFQRKLALAIDWLEYLYQKANYDDLQLDCEEKKSIKDSIKFLKSLN